MLTQLPILMARIVQAMALGFAEHYFAETNGEGNSGKGVDILGGIRGEDDEVCVHTFGDVTRVRTCTSKLLGTPRNFRRGLQRQKSGDARAGMPGR